MKTMRRAFLCLLLIVFVNSHIFSQDEAWDQHVSRGAGETIKHGLIAGADALLTSGTITAFNFFIQQTSWALPSGESVKNHFTKPWKWEDTDDFTVNNLGHPVHGAVFHTAARIHGFSFYPSLLFNAFGAFTWEALGESNPAAANDLITTTITALAPGEMLYRLYLEACAAGLPEFLTLFVNPMAGLHRVFSGWEPPNTGRNLYQFRISFGGAYGETHYSAEGIEQEVFSFKGPLADIGAKVVYGNPFEQDTRIPYRHFELMLFYGLDIGNYKHFRIVSDGYLFSFSPVYSAVDTMSTGLSMHFDFQTHGLFGVEDGAVDQFSNALDWTIKYQHLFSRDTAVQLKLHAGLTFFGTSKYFANNTVVNDFGHIKTDYNNFGTGFNGKLFSAFEYKWGRLELSKLYYILWTFPGTTHFSQGTVYWLFTDLGYYHYITKHFSLGITYSYVMERGSFSDGYPDTRKSNEVFKLLVVWDL